MNKRDRGILYGMSVGDGGIYILKDQSAKTARMVIGHSPKQLAYLEHKNELLYSIFGGKLTKINTYSSFNKRTEKTYVNTQLCRTEKYFRQMHRVLYKTGTKKYTKQLLSYITDHGLAIWYMDDGSLSKRKYCSISTYCSMKEAEIIRDWFIKNYGITPRFLIDKRNDKVSLGFSREESLKLISIVSPYVHESMKYKIDVDTNYETRVRNTPKTGDDIVHI